MPVCPSAGPRPLYEGKWAKSRRRVDGFRQKDKPASVIIRSEKTGKTHVLYKHGACCYYQPSTAKRLLNLTLKYQANKGVAVYKFLIINTNNR